MGNQQSNNTNNNYQRKPHPPIIRKTNNPREVNLRKIPLQQQRKIQPSLQTQVQVPRQQQFQKMRQTQNQNIGIIKDDEEKLEQNNRYMERVFVPQVNMPVKGTQILPHPKITSTDIDYEKMDERKREFEKRINREEEEFLRDLENKKKNFYKNKNEQVNQFQDELNNFEKNNNPFKILNISYEASESEVKNAYKKLALKFHPDKTELDKNVASHHFKQITKAYIYLMKKFGELKNVKTQEDIRMDARNYFEGRENGRGNRSEEGNMIEADRMSIGESKNFDVNRFNKIFEENRMESVFDKGYGGKWDEDEVDESSVFNSKFTLDIFNKVFENNKESKKYNKPQGQLIKRPEPEALTSGRLTFTEIGLDGMEDFSSGLNSTIGFEDYKAAYTYRSKIEKPEVNRKEYRNVKELEADRSREQILSREEREELDNYKKWQDEREMNRMLNVKKEEEYLEKYNSQINRLFIKK
jgi:curved DNA-binding protein CbpA